MKKASLSSVKFKDRLANKKQKIVGSEGSKKKKKKEDDSLDQNINIKYDEIIIKSVQFKLGWVSLDRKSLGIDYQFKFIFDLDAIQANKMNKTMERQDASRSTIASIASKYSKKRKSDNDDDDDDDDEQQQEEEEEEEEEEEDEEDEEDDDSDKEFETLMHTKGVQTVKKRLFIKAYQLPIINPYATFTCRLKPLADGSLPYPPLFENMEIMEIRNDLFNKLPTVSKLVKDMMSVAPHASVTLRNSVKSIDSKKSDLQGIMITSMDMIYDFITNKEMQMLAGFIFRDTFRSDETYWLACNFDINPTTIDDYRALEIYMDILDNKLLDYYAFSAYYQPLSIAKFLNRIMPEDGIGGGPCLVALTEEDTNNMINFYHIKPHSSSSSSSSVDEDDNNELKDILIECNKLWVHMRRNVALYQGRLTWNLGGQDYNNTEVSGKALKYLLENDKVVTHPSDPTIVVPVYGIMHWAALIQLCSERSKYVSVTCLEQITSSVESVNSLFDTYMGSETSVKRTLVICPTKQSREKIAKAVAGLMTLCADNISDEESAPIWMRTAIDKRIANIIFYESHLFSIKQMRETMAGFYQLLVKMHSEKCKYKMRIFLVGVNTALIHNEHQTHNAGFHYLLSSGVPLEGPPLNMRTGVVDSAAPKITGEVLESANGTTVNLGHDESQQKTLSVITLPTKDNGKDLSNADIVTIVAFIGEVINKMNSSNRKVCFLFENNAHMNQIVNQAEFSSNACSAFFKSSKLQVGDYVTEPDGGSRRLLDITIQTSASGQGGPGMGAAHKNVNSVDLNTMPAELIYYSLKKNTRAEYASKPITSSRYGCISKMRISSQKDIEYVGIFTVADRKYSQSDLNYLNYLSTGTLILLTVPKKTGWETRPVSYMGASNINLFDMAYASCVVEENKDE